MLAENVLKNYFACSASTTIQLYMLCMNHKLLTHAQYALESHNFSKFFEIITKPEKFCLIFFILVTKSPTHRGFMDGIKIQDIENLILGHLYIYISFTDLYFESEKRTLLSIVSGVEFSIYFPMTIYI